MRVLVVADIHYALPQYDWVLDVAAKFDLLVLAGDHLDITSMVDIRAQIVVVRKYLSRLKERTRLIVCSGNHDLDSRNETGEKTARWILLPRREGTLTDGDTFRIGDTLFTICPWWDGPATKAAIARQLADDSGRRGKHWIWIHHAPPDHSPISWGGSHSFGDTDLTAWIAQYGPDIVLSGHVHQAPFVKDGSWVDRIGSTWVFNAGHQFGAPPSHLILDTDSGTAYWFSAAGNEYVDLRAPLQRPTFKLQALPEWLT